MKAIRNRTADYYIWSNTLLDDLVPFTEQYVAAVSDTTVSKILTIAGDLAYVLHGVPGDGRAHCETMKNSKKNGEPPLET